MNLNTIIDWIHTTTFLKPRAFALPLVLVAMRLFIPLLLSSVVQTEADETGTFAKESSVVGKDEARKKVSSNVEISSHATMGARARGGILSHVLHEILLQIFVQAATVVRGRLLPINNPHSY